MKIISWNVNGIRAAIKKDFIRFLEKEKPDILCLQEIKIDDVARAKESFDFKNYEEYWYPAQKKGYSGTAILVKSGPPAGGFKVKSYRNGMGIKKFDREGRVQILELEKFYLINAYYPNSNHELSRLGYKLEFNKEILKYSKKLESPSTSSPRPDFGELSRTELGTKAGREKPVVICGDFNVAHEEIDLARPKENIGNPGFTYEERRAMTEFLRAGFIDSYRYLNGKKVQYTWWSYRAGARPRNIGWRIDYFCISEKMKKQIKKAFILDKIIGSDHCPIGIEINSKK